SIAKETAIAAAWCFESRIRLWVRSLRIIRPRSRSRRRRRRRSTGRNLARPIEQRDPGIRPRNYVPFHAPKQAQKVVVSRSLLEQLKDCQRGRVPRNATRHQVSEDDERDRELFF